MLFAETVAIMANNWNKVLQLNYTPKWIFHNSIFVLDQYDNNKRFLGRGRGLLFFWDHFIHCSPPHSSAASRVLSHLCMHTFPEYWEFAVWYSLMSRLYSNAKLYTTRMYWFDANAQHRTVQRGKVCDGRMDGDVYLCKKYTHAQREGERAHV